MGDFQRPAGPRKLLTVKAYPRPSGGTSGGFSTLNTRLLECPANPRESEMALELENYLNNHSFNAKTEGSTVIVNEVNVEQNLELFLEETNHTKYSIRKIDTTNLLISREVPIEDFGFLRCEMCGYVVSNEEELLTHRRAHGIQLL
jgi:hypothetical protein